MLRMSLIGMAEQYSDPLIILFLSSTLLTNYN